MEDAQATPLAQEGGGDREDTGPKATPPAEGDSAPGTIENAFTQSSRIDWEDPTSKYEEAQIPVLSIAPDQVECWVAALRQDHVAVVRGLDSRVLFSAEYAVADAAPFNTGEFERCIVSRDAASPATARLAQARSAFPTLSVLFDTRFGPRPRLFIVRAYGSAAARDWIKQLPFLPFDLQDLVVKLKAVDRYLLVLTTPEDVEMTHDRPRLSIFQHVADFVFPLLASLGPDGLGVLVSLLEQYKARMWTASAGDHRLDREFYREVLSDIRSDNLVKIVECGNTIQVPEGVHTSRAQLFRKAVDVIRSSVQGDWPDDSSLIEQTVLFAGGYFDDVPAEDFDSVVRQLLGSATVRLAKPVRGLERDKAVTEIRAYRDVALVDIWARDRHELIVKCGLRAQVVDGGPRITCPGAKAVRQRFSSSYPFTYAELWQRAVSTGLLFHPSEPVATKWTEAVLERMEISEGSRLNQLLELMFADNALGPFEGDFGDRFDALAETPQGPFVLSRIVELLKQMAKSSRLTILVDKLLIGLVSGKAPATALRLLQQLEMKEVPLNSRLNLVRSVLHHARREQWDYACALLREWASEPVDALGIVSWIGGRLDASTIDTGPLVAVAGVLVPIALRWAANPEASHGLAEFLRVAPRNDKVSADMVQILVRWLFHPAFEQACVKERFRGISISWLLPQRYRALRDDQASLGEMRNLAYAQFAREFIAKTDVNGASRSRVLAIRECQVVLLADWLDGLTRGEDAQVDRALLEGALREHLTPRIRREFIAALASLASAAAWMHEAGRGREWTALSFDEEAQYIGRRQQAIQALDAIVRTSAASPAATVRVGVEQ